MLPKIGSDVRVPARGRRVPREVRLRIGARRERGQLLEGRAEEEAERGGACVGGGVEARGEDHGLDEDEGGEEVGVLERRTGPVRSGVLVPAEEEEKGEEKETEEKRKEKKKREKVEIRSWIAKETTV